MKKHELRTCSKCGELTTVTLSKPNHILHAIMTLLTGGLWLLIWGIVGFESLCRHNKPALCIKCSGGM